MTSRLPQQNPMQNFTFPRTAPLPQHGQPSEKACLRDRPAARVVRPRPGH